MNAQDIMTVDPLFVDIKTTIREVIDMFYENDFRHIPVCAGRELVGIISDRDLRHLTASVPLDPDERAEYEEALDGPIGELMQGDVISVDPEDDITDVIDLMIDQRIGAVPVQSSHDGSLVGIISYIDVLREAQGLF